MNKEKTTALLMDMQGFHELLLGDQQTFQRMGIPLAAQRMQAHRLRVNDVIAFLENDLKPKKREPAPAAADA